MKFFVYFWTPPILKCYQKTQQLKLCWNSKTQIVMKLKNSNCYKTQKKFNCDGTQTLIAIKLKKSNCDNSKIHIVTKLKMWREKKSKAQNVTKLKNSIYEKTQKLKLWQNPKTLLWQNSNCDQTQKLQCWQNLSQKLQLWQK